MFILKLRYNETEDRHIMSVIKVFAGTSGRALATEVCRYLSIPLGVVDVGRFADGEVRVKDMEDVRGHDVFIINSLCPPAENWIEMLFLIATCRASSARRITIVPTYLGYNRQDRKMKSREPVSAQVMLSILGQSGCHRALMFDVHSEASLGVLHHCRVIVDHLYGSIASKDYLLSQLVDDFRVGSPDKGGVPRAEAYAKMLGLDIDDTVVFLKRRTAEGGVDGNGIHVSGDVKGRDLLLVDDMIDTSGTVCKDAEVAKREGAKRIFVFATHPLLSGQAIDRINQSPIDQVIITDSIPHNAVELTAKCSKIKVLSVAELLAKAIRRINNEQSLGPLFI